MLTRSIVARYKLSISVKDYLRDFQRSATAIEQDLRAGDTSGAKKKFQALGEVLKPLATLLDSVRYNRKDEQRKMKNVVQWLWRLKYPFESKFLQGDKLAVESWISTQIPYIEDTLKSLVRVQGRLDAYQTTEKTFSHGPFKFINKFGYRPDEYETVIQMFDKATDKIRSKGFGGILYGDIYLVGASEGKGRKTWAGMYREANDDILLNVEAKHRFDDVFTLVHEFGHRHWFKKLTGPQRDAYEDHYSGKTGIDLTTRQDMWQALVKADFSPSRALKFLNNPDAPLLEWFKYIYGGYKQKELLGAHQRGEAWVEKNFVQPKHRYVFPTDDVNAITVSQYAKSNVKEDYAETFAHYVLGMSIPPEVLKRFELVTK